MMLINLAFCANDSSTRAAIASLGKQYDEEKSVEETFMEVFIG
jgi:hypothetical protein